MRCRPRPSHMNTSPDSPILLIAVLCILPIFKGGLTVLFLLGMFYLFNKYNKVGGK